MNSLFHGLRNPFNNRENAVKESLISNLSENAKEIQFEFKENGKDYLELLDCTNSLSTTLEAIFLHGLKDSFLWQTLNVISGDVDRRPEPSFWSPLLIFLHKQVIEQIQELSQITTEIGCCRCWIRLSLNDSLLSSYLNNIRKNSPALNPYYKKYAFLKDADNLEVASKIIEGIESCVQINLPINSSLLNQWSDLALELAGIWTPPLRSYPIASGIDVASSLTNNVAIPTPKPLEINEFFSDSISNSPFRQSSMTAQCDLSDQENLQILLRKVDEMERIAEEEQNLKKDIDISEMTNSCSSMKSPESNDIVFGNSVTIKTGWSGEIDENAANNNCNPQTNNNTESNEGGGLKLNFSRSNSTTTSISSLKSPIDRHSYNTLLVKHHRNRELDWSDVWERFESSIGIGLDGSGMAKSSISTDDTAIDNLENLGFEVVPQSLTEKFTVQELQQMVNQACKLANELGLDSQGFVCETCAHPVGIGFATAQVCSFNGHYYCENCMSLDLYIIPAKIIYNWDFRKYNVSKKAAVFLSEFQFQPFLDLKLLNCDIYMACEEMATLQSLRIRLNFIRAYLFTCCEPIIEELKKQVWTKEYLYEHIHNYSISDLTMIHKGSLAQLLIKIVNFGEKHILNCRLCSQKGFICEICNSPKVLYPFHIDTTFRCKFCGAVFHQQCLDESQPCPKCERKRKREDLPLFEAVHML